MAEQIKVESRTIRSVSSTLGTEASNLFSHFETMQQQIQSFTNRMRGTTIDTIDRQFQGMRPVFERIRTDIQAYSQWLSQAAEEYERLEREQTAQAQQQGRVF